MQVPRLWRVVAGSVLLVLLAWAGIGMYAGYVALQKEYGLHAVFRVQHLLPIFVQATGRWPQNWTELQSIPHDDPRLIDPKLSQKVAIDFTVTVDDVVAGRANPATTIRPLIDCFPHEEYVESCFAEIRQIMRERAARLAVVIPEP